MELEAWNKTVNSRLRFCLCIVLFSLLTEEFFLLNHLIGSSTLSLVQAFRCGKCHSLLSGSSTLFFFYHSHRFRQRLASVFTTHHFSLTNKRPWEHVQRLLILLVRFIFPCPPSPIPQFLGLLITGVTKPIGD